MAYFDIFNGDADGICALHQLRLHTPRESQLITGVKRDIALLARVRAGMGDHLTVLDISLEKNQQDLRRLLDAGAKVEYFDHHFAGDIPKSDQLRACIDPSAEVCTSLLVNHHLQGAHLPWAVVGAFGDNLHAQARQAAAPLALSDDELQALARLGERINYNAYGVTLDDLWITPQELYRQIQPFPDPFDFMREAPAFATLDEGYREDMQKSETLDILLDTPHAVAFLLPDAPWARRVSGVLGNQLARRHPQRAHALITTLPDDIYRISVRAPLSHREHADTLCMRFPTGGGRKAAAGINALPSNKLEDFLHAFETCYAPCE